MSEAPKENYMLVPIEEYRADKAKIEAQAAVIELLRIENADAVRLAERLKEAEGVIEFYANPVNWHRFDYSFMTANNIVDDDCADYSHITRDVRMTGGKRARAYLSKTPKKEEV